VFEIHVLSKNNSTCNRAAWYAEDMHLLNQAKEYLENLNFAEVWFYMFLE